MARILENPATQLDHVIEIGETAIKAVIVRNGTTVFAPAVDHLKVDALVDRLAPVGVTLSPRVLAQSVAVGTRIPKGSSVDLVLAAPVDIDVGIIVGAHESLRARAIADIAPVIADAKISAVLEKYADLSKATEADRAVISGAAQMLDIQVDPDPASGRSLEALFNTLHVSQAFL